VYLYTFVLGTVSLLVSLFDRDGRGQHAIARVWAQLILKTLFCPLRIRGAERLRVTRPVIFALNHGSALDIPASYVAIPVPFRVLAKSELFRYPFLGWHLHRSGQISIEQGKAKTTMRSLARAADALRAGMPLLAYPEGGRCEDGHLQPFQPGVFYVALKARCDIVPVALVGTWDALRMNSYHVRPHPITVVVGEPISTAEYGRHDTEKLSARVQQAIADMYYEHASVTPSERTSTPETERHGEEQMQNAK
jgi:1-acyl-sn-glycerol-3-phosphate acyltransferase